MFFSKYRAPVLPRRGGAYTQDELRGRRVLAQGALADVVRAQGGVAAGAEGPLDAVVLDASRFETVDALRQLHEVLHPAVPRLGAGGRVLLLAAATSRSAEAAACARAVEGFTRSLARELGRRGATANCLYLEPGASLDAALAFFCSERSAYVSGQALRWQAASPVPQAARRTAVVTGAAGGIGAATVRRLAAGGDRVLCVDVPQASEALQALVKETGGAALSLDLTAADARGNSRKPCRARAARTSSSTTPASRATAAWAACPRASGTKCWT